jgi:DNA anti-recombination protein RmuC
MTRSIASRLREGNLFCQEAADYIEKLETSLKNAKSNTIKQGTTLTNMVRHKGDRIEKLEAALAHIYAWYPVSVSDPAQTIRDIREFARKSLEGKDD